ncbi:MAG TPA: hypothetical protein VN541_17620 [Tepidisphaeraceae bacterium]|nr:hypothetical protein [Tepidisphaeraceae bacterium]
MTQLHFEPEAQADSVVRSNIAIAASIRLLAFALFFVGGSVMLGVGSLASSANGPGELVAGIGAIVELFALVAFVACWIVGRRQWANRP